MAILSMPATPKMRRTRFTLRGHTQTFAESPSREAMTKGLEGVRWAGTFEVPPMKRDQAAAWCAFLARCNGRAERFYAGDPAGATPRGTGIGTPIVYGAGQTGYSLHIGGWTPGNPPLLTGDYIAWTTPSGWREMHKLTASASSIGRLYGTGTYGTGPYGGCEAIVSFVPAIRESPANGASVVVSGAMCVMRLVDDDQGAWDVDTAMFYGLRFAAEEVWS